MYKPHNNNEWMIIRNSQYDKHISQGTIKKRILKELELIECVCCNNTISARHVCLDHKVPVMIGGEEESEGNLQLLCTLCHQYKTWFDNRFIKFFYSIGILKKVHKGCCIACMHPLKIIELYNCLKENSGVKI